MQVDTKGKISKGQITSRNKSSSKRTERSPNSNMADFFREGEAAYQLAAIVASSDDAIISKTLDGIITSWNAAAERLYLFTASEVIGKPVSIIYPPDKQDELERILEMLARGEHIEHFETVRLRKDGQRVSVSLSVSPVRGKNGEIIGAAAIGRDLTGRKNVEAELRRRERQQAAVARLGIYAFENTDIQALMDEVAREVAAMLEVDYCKVLELQPDGKELLLKAGVGWKEGLVGTATISSGLSSQAGYTLRSDKPVIVEDLSTEKRFYGSPLLIDNQIKSGLSVIIPCHERPYGVLEAHTRERRVFTQDDIYFIQSVANLVGSAVQRKITENELRSLNETLEKRVAERTAALQLSNSQLRSEINEREKAERKLERANRILVSSNRELQDFAYIASHDLQEPLRKIRSFSELLNVEYGEAFDEMGRYYLDRVNDAASRMSRLINDLLMFSRLVTQAKPFEEVDLNQIIEDVLSDLEVRIAEVKATIEADTLPVVEADPTQMRQVLLNLISNALKFLRPDVSPVVWVTSEAVVLDGKKAYRITVTDNGIGFEQKQAERIFSPFKRLHSRNEYPGTGIGLAIVRRIIERHNGTVSATSTPGIGSSFVVTLPVHHEKTLDVQFVEGQVQE